MSQTSGLSEGREIKFKFQVGSTLTTVALYLPEGNMVVKTFGAEEMRQVVSEIKKLESMYNSCPDSKALDAFLISRFQVRLSYPIKKVSLSGYVEKKEVTQAKAALSSDKKREQKLPWYAKNLLAKTALFAKLP